MKMFSLFFFKQNKQALTWQEVIDIRNATFQLQDRIGLMTHHDAGTGTCKQRVWADYSQELAQAFQIVRQQGAYLMAKQVLEDTGLETKNMTFCDRLNGSYVNCPIG